MRWAKLAIFAALLAGIILFNFLFKDRLLERGLESGLQAVFRARADVQGLRFELLKARVRLSHLEVADKDEPFRNLFELGRTEIDLDLAQLLRKKVVIENAACRDIRWDMPRKTSGALPAAKKTATPPAAPPSSTGVLQHTLANLLTFDPAAIVEREKARLQSLEKASALNSRITTSVEKAKASLRSLEASLAGAGEGVAAAQKTDFGGIKTLEAAQKEYQRLSELSPLVKGLEKDTAAFTGEVKGEAGTLVSRYLQQKLGKLYRLALMARQAALNLKGGGGQKSKPPLRRAGREVGFPTTVYPRFLLKSFTLSLGSRQAQSFLEASLRDLASDPELWGRPVSYRLERLDQGRSILAAGFLDARGEAEDAFGLELQAEGFPFQIKEGLEWARIGSLSGSYAAKADLTLSRAGETRGSLLATGREIRVEGAGREHLLSQVLLQTLQGASGLALEADYRISPEGNFSARVRSSLDEEISRRLARKLGELGREYGQKLKEELQRRLAPELARNAELMAGLKGLGSLATGKEGQAAGYRKALDAKAREYSAAVKRLSSGAGDKLKEAAGKLKLPGF